MSETDLLNQIRNVWLNRCVQKLARGAANREDFRGQLECYFDLMVQAIETGETNWLDSVLSQWATSLTQTDLEQEFSTLSHLIKEMITITIDTAREMLTDSEAMLVIVSLTPVFTYSFEKAAKYEMKAQVKHVTDELEETRSTLERLERSKSDFIAIAAHELRTPLTLVEGYAAMLRDMLPRQADAPQQAMMAGIDNGTRRLRAIINDMIDVSMIDNDLLSLSFQPVWMNRLLSILASEFKGILSERNIALTVNAFSGFEEMFFADPERLLQALRNVLSNAVKFTPDGGKIDIRGRKLSDFLEVIVEDTGIGIAPDDQGKIFDKFGRLGDTALHSSGKTKFKGGGPGLGLHITRGIVEAHGGAIWVESEGYDEKNCPGTTFHILMPMRAAPPDDKTAKLFAPLIQLTKDQIQS
ncbi:MAG TPA: HAMP domain-containing sensor histidine kinase [Anaerolineaceae bacterium]|nr:HAMP domain-containing sensor histidine kinase [Anaerolineaceae bacterium]HPN52955.1 HAMP domain-containing sensor histidine kinase [Anaerolineaceae bacterium]